MLQVSIIVIAHKKGLKVILPTGEIVIDHNSKSIILFATQLLFLSNREDMYQVNNCFENRLVKYFINLILR